MKKGMIVLVAVTLLAPLTLMAQHGSDPACFGPPKDARMGQGHPGMPDDGAGPRDRGPGIRRLLMAGDKIGLTDEQRDQLKQMQVDHQMEQIDRKAELKKAQVLLRTLTSDPEAPERDVMRMIDDVAGLKAALTKARYAQRMQIRSVLTEEQIEKIKELRKEQSPQMPGKFRGPRGQGRRGGWGRP